MRLEGKTATLYVEGLRPRHVIGAYEDLGMQVVGTGHELAHTDDYQRTFAQAKESTVTYDDVTAHEMEELVRHLRPDLEAREGPVRGVGSLPCAPKPSPRSCPVPGEGPAWDGATQ